MNKFVLKTLGCKTNQIESAIIQERLCSSGFKCINSIENAGYFIINSCCVTANANDKSILLLKQAKKINPEIKTVLVGCVANISADDCERLQKNEFIDLILGNSEKLEIDTHLINFKSKIDDIQAQTRFQNYKIPKIERTRANLKIQDGCDNMCSYCTIPLARGKNRSNTLENIIEQINTLEKNGYKEIILTGIHIGQWGRDFGDGEKFVDLLKEIEKTKIHRYRLSSLEPPELNDDLLDFLMKSEKFCPHFHLSLQSLCDKTLHNMNRKYYACDAMKIIEKIHKKFDSAFLGCDIIVGFPNETDEDFETTYLNLKNSGLSQIHVFPYSKRENTPAFSMQNQIKQTIKTQRSKKLRTLSSELFNLFLEKNINHIHEVIVEKNIDKKTGLQKGLTKNYINVFFDAKSRLGGSLQKVKILNHQNSKVFAQILTN